MAANRMMSFIASMLSKDTKTLIFYKINKYKNNKRRTMEFIKNNPLRLIFYICTLPCRVPFWIFIGIIWISTWIYNKVEDKFINWIRRCKKKINEDPTGSDPEEVELLPLDENETSLGGDVEKMIEKEMKRNSNKSRYEITQMIIKELDEIGNRLGENHEIPDVVVDSQQVYDDGLNSRYSPSTQTKKDDKTNTGPIVNVPFKREDEEDDKSRILPDETKQKVRVIWPAESKKDDRIKNVMNLYTPIVTANHPFITFETLHGEDCRDEPGSKIVLPCIAASRIGSDIQAALNKSNIHFSTKLLLLLFNHTAPHVKKIMTRNKPFTDASLKNRFTDIIDVYYWNSKIYDCPENRTSLEELANYMGDL